MIAYSSSAFSSSRRSSLGRRPRSMFVTSVDPMVSGSMAVRTTLREMNRAISTLPPTSPPRGRSSRTWCSMR
ncbi:hypothetical protein [Streptomyces sp. NPDC050164]|uniref:hypothetical protein n=1 Tax=Streptomyces sp. NPDC050164 TaxID=3365605 RepID=UPI003795F848